MHNLAETTPPPPALASVRRMLTEWHQYQLAYYADKARQRTHYIGMPAWESSDRAGLARRR